MDDTAYEQCCDEHTSWLSGWSLTHDYDPTWDYTVAFEYREHPLFLGAERTVAEMCARAASNPEIHFDSARVFPAHLDGPVAIYVHGTSSEPVVLVDIDAHVEHADTEDQMAAVMSSVVHELRHAVQEDRDYDACEDEAEHGSSRMPF